jgi:proton-dependent oligopeptide transporter, POT family
MSAANPAAPSTDEVTLFGHPVSLFVLFFSEFWERFSFYGMRALLVLYMIDQVAGLGYSDEKAYAVYGAYGAMVYATPAIGGLLADRVLGYRKAIILGAVLMALGHFAMAIEHPAFFYGALGLLILGNGFFKPNISSLVGKLYADGDPRRDSAFTIFYMGINAGAMVAPIACSALVAWFAIKGGDGEIIRKAWHYGFGLAGIGMVVGLITFLVFQKHLGDKGLAPTLPEGGAPPTSWQIATYVVPFLALPAVMWLVTQHEVLGGGLLLLGGAIFGYLAYHSVRSEKVERERMWVVLVLMFFSMLFWAFFEQAGSSISVFTERNVDRVIFGSEISAENFQAVNPLFILLLAPVFAGLWTFLGRRGADPSTPIKFALGIIQLGLGFVVLWYGASHAQAGMVAVGWLLAGYLLHTTGELCLSPVGLSMVTKLSPARMVGLVMGAWFLATSFSHYLAGMIAAMTGSSGEVDASTLTAAESVVLYEPVFMSIAAVACGAGVVLLILSPVLTRWMHSADAEPAAGGAQH